MTEITAAQKGLIDAGLAEVYNGRLIPIMRGGSEAEPEPAPDPVEPPAEPAAEPAEEPDAEPAPEAEPELPPAAAIDWDSPEAQAAIDGRLDQFAQERLPQPEPEPGFDWNGLDPFEDDFGSKLKQGLTEIIQGAVAPLAEVAETAQNREAREGAIATMDSLGVSEDDRGNVIQIAAGIEAAAQNAGRTISLDGALRHAVQTQQDRDKRIGEAAIATYKADLAAKAGAPAAQPPAGPAGVHVEPSPDSLIGAAHGFVERHNLGQ